VDIELGPPATFGWLAANCRRFGFIKRYAWVTRLSGAAATLAVERQGSLAAAPLLCGQSGHPASRGLPDRNAPIRMTAASAAKVLLSRAGRRPDRGSEALPIRMGERHSG
jgi:hypothetical protein